jgi:uncharacterized protein (DUF302 family)
MHDDGPRVVLRLPFEAAVGAVTKAIHADGMAVIARVDVRDHFKIDLRREFRQYVLIEAWSAAQAWEAIQADPDSGPALPIRFGVYERGENETVVIADASGQRAAHVLERLRPHLPNRPVAA